MTEGSREKLKMLVVCAETDLAQDWEAGFQKEGVLSLGHTNDAMNALSMVEKWEPNLLVMEPYLPGMNCDELTAILERQASPFLVKMVISPRKQDLLASRFMAEGGDLFRIGPLDYRYTLGQVYEYLERRRSDFTYSEESADGRVLNELGEILHWLGMRRSLKGYSYIRLAAMLGMRDHTLLHDLKNRIYPIIALMERTNGYCVEKCMRVAIEIACKDGEAERIYRYFHPKPDNGTIGNKEFISDLIALHHKGLQNLK